jgi:hypothetical protein
VKNQIRPVRSIYVADAQIQAGIFTISFILTIISTIAADFTSIEGNNFSSWYNPVQGTFGDQFQTMFTTESAPGYILTGNDNQLMYLAANTGTITSFDGQAPVLSGSVSAYGVLANVFLG